MTKLAKVPSGGTYTPDKCYRLFLIKKRKVCSFDSEDNILCYINTTLKDFTHTLCEAHDLDLKGKALVQGLNTSEINQPL